MEWLFSWEVSSWIVGLAVSIAFGLAAMDDFKWARLFFLLAAADAGGGVVMWGVKAQNPTWQVLVVVFILMGSVGVCTVLALRYVDGKRKVKEGIKFPYPWVSANAGGADPGNTKSRVTKISSYVMDWPKTDDE
jgi:hypothetical protein